MTDKQFKDAFTAAGGWFFLTQYKLIDSLKDNRKELLDKLFEKGFDSELGGTRTRMASAIKIIKEDRAKEALEKIGIDWRTDKEIRWERGYNNAKKYYEANGNLLIPASYESGDGHRTGLWIRNQRKRYKEGKLSDKETELLIAIGFLETIS